MARSTRFTGMTLALLAAGATLAFTSPDTTSVDSSMNGVWSLRATDVSIIGGYGDNFDYDGSNVRPLKGSAEITVDPVAGTSSIVIDIETTAESGPIRFSGDMAWTGDIQITQHLNTRQMDKARIATDIWLHGDTGNEAPVMPKVYNYFATWGPASILVNGSEVIPMIGSHTMFTEQARNAKGRIVNDDGTVYNPMRENKAGYTNPEETEFHFVAHTTQPDQDNFPPHTGWIHLHFADVEILEKPDGVVIPYTDGS